MPQPQTSSVQTLNVPQTLAQAVELHRQGRLADAERLYSAILAVRPDQFEKQEGGAIRLTEPSRKALLSAYQQRKREEVTHPLTGQKVAVGRLPFLQARILARHLRGDLPAYVPCVLKN